MRANDERAARSGRRRAVSVAVARRSQRLRLIAEYLRSHDRLAEAPTEAGKRANPHVGYDRRARF
jgi:hypothetical protein